MDFVEIARAESERGELVLRERREAESSVLELRANGIFVMDTQETSSERALATVALSTVASPERVLVGGLGLGFTMNEVLADDRVRDCTVVEIDPALVGWMSEGVVPHGPDMLADSRIDVEIADVADVLEQASESSYDLVLLDVDNGPGYLVHESNGPLYRPRFLSEARAALRPGGALAVWSAAEEPELESSLAEVFDDVVPHPLEVNLQGHRESYWLYEARCA
ncbi:spermidine synthase [Rhodococcus sp. NPDC058521]|uniref:spermidine synthase n=1 Tax=Rhodococcus sp. NPDC058521 TaxID=3346536 RepID=UPI0036582F7A